MVDASDGSTVKLSDWKALSVFHDIHIRLLLDNIIHIEQNPPVAVQKVVDISSQL